MRVKSPCGLPINPEVYSAICAVAFLWLLAACYAAEFQTASVPDAEYAEILKYQ